MCPFGLDFGTTNSALAVFDVEAGTARLARFDDLRGGETPSFRSLLYFERDDSGETVGFAGPEAIARYRAAEEPGRLMQSLKSFLAARDFSATSVFGKPHRLEGLIGLLLRSLHDRAQRQLGPLAAPLVVGRPVRFVAAQDPEDDALAMQRLRAAFRNAGLGEIELEHEPVAAAYHYERRLDHDELILIGDIGGGTSDFCLLQLGPSRRSRSDALLDTEGVGVAGDSFDGSIVRHTVSPLLGLGSRIRSIFGVELDAPAWVYAHLERWHHLSFLRTPRSLQLLHDLCREAREPERFRALLYLVEQNLGFALHQAVEGAKCALSHEREAPLELVHGPLEIREQVLRSDFASWIWDDVEKLAGCVERLLGRHAIAPADVDRVFLTGGSSFVPAVRDLFATRFGREKIRSGEELTSVASGLALRAAELR